jgi:beta-phosphoglucomutase-like phosphatase (HAD superfamily)
VATGKPAPDVYLEACARLNTVPARAVAIEDSSNGLRAAASAGLAVIAVPNQAFPPSDDALALADVVLSSVGDVTVDIILSMRGEAADGR